MAGRGGRRLVAGESMNPGKRAGAHRRMRRLCGWIVWASAKAVNDPRAGVTPSSIGTVRREG